MPSRIGLAFVVGGVVAGACAEPCPSGPCVARLTIEAAGIAARLSSKTAYQALVCIGGKCDAAIFTLPEGTCTDVASDGSLCCRVTWAGGRPGDCIVRAGDLVLSMPLPEPSARGREVDVTILDSEGDLTLAHAVRPLPPGDVDCPAECRSVTVSL